MYLFSDEYCMDANMTGRPKSRSLIKSLGNGEVNYALTAVAPINYSLALQTAEAYIPFLTKPLVAMYN